MDQYIRSQLLSAVNNNDNDKIIETYQKIKSEGGLIIILYSWYACFSYLVLLRIRYNVMIMYVDYIAVKGGFITGGGGKGGSISDSQNVPFAFCGPIFT